MIPPSRFTYIRERLARLRKRAPRRNKLQQVKYTMAPGPVCIPRAGEPGGECSGRGICAFINGTTQSQCICDAPYASVGDFATDPSVDCGIEFPVTRALWAIEGLFQLALLFLCVRALLVKWREGATWKSSDVRITVLGLCEGLCLMVCGFLEASANFPGEHSIGISLETTLFFGFGASFFWLSHIYYCHLLLKTCLKQMAIFRADPRQVRIMEFLAKWLPFYGALCIFACFIPLGIVPVMGHVPYVVRLLQSTRTCTNVRVRTSEKSRQIAVNAYIMIIYYSASRKQEDLVYLASCTVYYSLMHSNLGQNPQKVSF